MGLASSQARLLNLTSRMHQIEYNAAKIEAQKLQMANESRQVYNEYQEALEQTKVQIKQLTSDGAVTFVDISSIESMVSTGFAIVVHDVPADLEYVDPPIETKTALITTSQCKESYNSTPETSGTNAGKHKGTVYVSDGNGGVKTETRYITTDVYNGLPDFYINNGTNLSDSSKTDFVKVTKNASAHTDLICRTKEALVAAIKLIYNGLDISDGLNNNFERTITNLFNAGNISIIQKKPNGGGFPKPNDDDYPDYLSSIATNTSFQEVTDESGLRKAEAKYEASMRQIDMKDRKFDYDLAALDNERNAVKNEMETLKTVAKDNVDRTFKLFT